MASLNVLELCQVTPPPTTVVTEKSLPLTFFDLPWIHFPPIQHLLFYEFPNSTTQFMHTTIPSLKHSLSLTLKHFYPLAGKLLFPPNSSKPEIRYVDGNSVSLTFAESTNDFDTLTGKHARNTNEFRSLLPPLPPGSTMSSGELAVPLLAVQVTLFPNSGICVGFALRHVAADGMAFISFIRSWGSISKLGGDEALVASGSLPFLDRTVIKDPKGLETIIWNQVGKKNFDGSPPQNHPAEMVLATFVMSHTSVQNLKKWVSTQCPTLSHVSAFTVTCAYVWACMVKARARSGEEVVGEAELEHFVFAADCRGHLDPPIPPTYFGNCIAPCLTAAKSAQLSGEDGFVVAAEAIGNAIQERLQNEEGILKGAQNWISDIASLKPERLAGITGSPKFAVYEIDFGWGKPKKSEVISIGTTRAMSINEGRDAKGDLEIALCFPKIKMEAFAAIFADSLKVLRG